jgi:hypothetical protein
MRGCSLEKYHGDRMICDKDNYAILGFMIFDIDRQTDS